MPQITAPFESCDFFMYANRTYTVEISLKDPSGNWLVPPFTKGYFAIFTYAGQPPLFERDTTGSSVRFALEAKNPIAGQWYLSADILPTDTVALPAGVYYYEARMDFAGGLSEVKSGIFLLKATFI